MLKSILIAGVLAVTAGLAIAGLYPPVTNLGAGGGAAGFSPWTADTNGINYTSGSSSVGIGTTSNASYSLIAASNVGSQAAFNSSNIVGQPGFQLTDGATFNGGMGLADAHTWSLGYVNGSWVPSISWNDSGQTALPAGTAGAVLCLTSTHLIGHCTAAASCTSTCTCTCAAN